MPPTPSRAGAADGDAPAAVTRGASALRDFLARESHARGSRADPRAFADWLEDETFARIRSDEAFALRAYANGLRRRHAALLDPLLAAVADAEAAYDASDDAARIRAAATDVERANAAVAGIRRFLDDPPRAEAEATTKNDAKRLATRAKLDAVLARLPIAERHLNDVRASSEIHRARADTRAALAEAREAVGLADAEAAAAEASRIFGGDVVDKGKSFETTCEAIVRDFLHRDPNAFRSSSLDREEGDLWLLRNVTLGMAAGEIDLAVVRARRDDPSAFVDANPRDGDGVRRRAGNDTTAEGARDASGPDSESAPAVDVLAIVECKRNPDDVARGFHARQTTLGWLAGSDYDPEDWRNTRHPTGHFARGYHPVRLATRVAVPGEDAAAARESGEKTPSGVCAHAAKFSEVSRIGRERGGVLLARALVHHARADDDGDGRQGTRDEKEVRRDSIAVRVRPHAAIRSLPFGARGISFREIRTPGGRIWGAVARVLRDPPTMTALFIVPPRSKGGTLATSSRGFKPRAFYCFATHISDEAPTRGFDRRSALTRLRRRHSR